MVLALLLVLWTLHGCSESAAAPSGRISSRSRILLAALLLLHAGIGLWQIRTTPGRIDCLTFQRDAVQTLLHGQNPFGGSHENVYSADETARFYGEGMVVNGRVQIGLQYPPITLVAATPGYLLGDVRYGYLLVTLLTAVVLAAALPDPAGVVAAALLLLDPATWMVEARCWTEPLVFLLLCTVYYCLRRRPALLGVALGLFLASKQYNVLALPFVALLVRPFSWRAWAKLLAQSLAVAALTVLPFALWNPRALWHDLAQFHLAQPFRADAVSFAVQFHWAMTVGPLLLLLFMVWAVLRVKPGGATFSAVYAAGILIFFVTGKQAFCNYYFLITQSFLLAAAGLWPEADAGSQPMIEQ